MEIRTIVFVSLLSIALSTFAGEKNKPSFRPLLKGTRETASEMTTKFKASVIVSIMDNADKPQDGKKVPLNKLRWETLSCHTAPAGTSCYVDSTETQKWGKGREKMGVQIWVDEFGNFDPEKHSIWYDCIGCAG